MYNLEKSNKSLVILEIEQIKIVFRHPNLPKT